MADVTNRLIICVDDNYIDQKKVRKTGLALNPPAFLSTVIRPGPCPEVWFLPRAATSLSMTHVLLKPASCQRLDAGVTLAVEVASTIGPGDISVDEAEAAIGWGRIALDVVRRDLPAEQAFLARSYPTHTPVADVRTRWREVPKGSACGLQLFVNGELRQHASLATQRAAAAVLLTQIARSIRLSPGDLLLTGTPHGLAFDGSEKWLEAGDNLVASIEGLGEIAVRVEQEATT